MPTRAVGYFFLFLSFFSPFFSVFYILTHYYQFCAVGYERFEMCADQGAYLFWLYQPFTVYIVRWYPLRLIINADHVAYIEAMIQ